MIPDRLILLAHGSRDPGWREPFERLAGRLGDELGEGRVRLAYLEMAAPSLEDEVGRAAEEDVRAVRVLPLLLAGGDHVRRDLPERVEALRKRHPEVGIDVLPHVGADPRAFDLLAMFAREAAEALSAADTAGEG